MRSTAARASCPSWARSRRPRATGWSRSSPPRFPTTGPIAGRTSTSRCWEEPREGTVDLVVDPGRAFGTGAHPTTRLCLEYLLELEAAGEGRGPLTDLGTGSGVLAIAAAKLGWDPVSGYDHEPASIEAAAANADANGVEATFDLVNLRESLPALAPVTVANMTASVLREMATQMTADGGRGRTRPSLPAVARTSPPPSPSTLVLSGLLPSELDDIAAAFAPLGLAEVDRRLDGDWAALLLRSR
jgi:ribosomal protein L11 methyltransferase